VEHKDSQKHIWLHKLPVVMHRCETKYLINTFFTSLHNQWSSFNFYHIHVSSWLDSPHVGLGLLIVEISRSHSDTPKSVGLLWTSDQPVAETSTWQHSTLTRDRHPWPGRDSNPQSQQASGRRPMC